MKARPATVSRGVVVVDKGTQIVKMHKLVYSAFSFGKKGAKEKKLRLRLRFAAFASKCTKRKTPKKKFRPLRRARRATHPPLRELLKKLDQNFRQTDESR